MFYRLIKSRIPLVLSFFVLISIEPLAQTPVYTWMGGSDVINQSGNFGTKGIPSTENIPSARQAASSWVDLSGNIWIYGGSGWDSEGNGGTLNDLWKFNPETLEWTWIGGSPIAEQDPIYGTKGESSPSNFPGARETSATWTDNSGNFWLFGGDRHDDLWRFDINNSEWTWISGSKQLDQESVFGEKGIESDTIYPGSRRYSMFATDSKGNFWLFGGYRYGTNKGHLGDLWMFNVKTQNWTWEGGVKDKNGKGLYGIQGEPSVDNQPGARAAGAMWIDGDDNIWIFGGNGYAKYENIYGELNDMWRYNPLTKEWTWVNGSDLVDQFADSNNTPIARELVNYTNNHENNPILFGGAYYNDLWEYNPINESWNLLGQGGGVYYGELGVSDENTKPSGRYSSVFKRDSIEKYWIFGGTGDDKYGNRGRLNDLWKVTFKPSNIDSIYILYDSITQSSFTISWKSKELADGYKVSISDDEFNSYINDYEEKAYTDTIATIVGLSPGVEYDIKIKSFNENGESESSKVYSVFTKPGNPDIDIFDIKQNEFTIYWLEVQGASSYELDISSDNFVTNLTGYDSLEIEDTTITVLNIQAGAKYFARIRSKNRSGLSSNSDTIEMITVPPVPILYDATNIQQDQFTISWSNSNGASSYEIDVSQDEFITYITGYDSLEVADTVFTVSDLEPGGEYSVRVRSKNESGISPNSLSKSIIIVGLVNEISKWGGIIYPNPLINKCNVDLPDNIHRASYQIITSDGNLLKEGFVDNNTNQINFDKYTPGIYIIILDQRFLFRMIKK